MCQPSTDICGFSCWTFVMVHMYVVGVSVSSAVWSVCEMNVWSIAQISCNSVSVIMLWFSSCFCSIMSVCLILLLIVWNWNCNIVLHFLVMLQNLKKWLLGLPCLSAWNMAPTGWNFMKFDTWEFFKAVSRKFKFNSKLRRLTATSFGDPFTFMICFWILLRMRNISDESYRENENIFYVQ